MNEEQERKEVPSGKAQDTPGGIRHRLRSARAALGEHERRSGSAAIMAHLRAGLKAHAARAGVTGTSGAVRIAAFWPMPGEPDLRELLAEWAGHGIALALPRVERRDAPLVFLPWHPGSTLRTGAYGILEPDGTQYVRPDIVLVPTLGYTLSGGRVGYGGGYYDRTLGLWRRERHPHTTVGIAWRASRLDEDAYAFAPHDMPLDAVVDEEGWHYPAR
ncbi:5-formyltetrahydrofolate cyclo-ligase [Verticiella sediminum]|nr:5-formyltetrahydrofolate cyclo-ligase [Verticiella sediminum]